MQMKSSLIRDVTYRRLLVGYRRFGKTYRYHPSRVKGQEPFLKLLDPWNGPVLSRNYETSEGRSYRFAACQSDRGMKSGQVTRYRDRKLQPFSLVRADEYQFYLVTQADNINFDSHLKKLDFMNTACPTSSVSLGKAPTKQMFKYTSLLFLATLRLTRSEFWGMSVVAALVLLFEVVDSMPDAMVQKFIQMAPEGKEKKSMNVRSGDFGGHSIGPQRLIHGQEITSYKHLLISPAKCVLLHPAESKTDIVRVPFHPPKFNHLNTKRRPLYLKAQSVPRSKHFSSRL